MASQMGGFRGRMDGPRQGAWLLPAAAVTTMAVPCLQGGEHGVRKGAEGGSHPGPPEGALCWGDRDRGSGGDWCVITSRFRLSLLSQGRESASAGSRDAQSPGVLGKTHTHHCVSWRVGLMRRAWEARGRGP